MIEFRERNHCDRTALNSVIMFLVYINCVLHCRCVVPTHSSRVVVENVTIDTGGKGPNTDGVEPMWSTDVRVTDVDIHNGDDCITVKSGSRNVFVENVRCRGSHGVTIGSVWYDDVVNVTSVSPPPLYANNTPCLLNPCHLSRVLRATVCLRTSVSDERHAFTMPLVLSRFVCRFK